MEGLCEQHHKTDCLQKTAPCINCRCAAELLQSCEWEWTVQKTIFLYSPAPKQLCLNYTVLTLTVFLYFSSGCCVHPQPGSATLLLIALFWVFEDTQAGLGFSKLKSKISPYFRAMPAALPWPPAQMEIIQPIQKEAFSGTVLPFHGDGHQAAERSVVTWQWAPESTIKLPRKIQSLRIKWSLNVSLWLELAGNTPWRVFSPWGQYICECVRMCISVHWRCALLFVFVFFFLWEKILFSSQNVLFFLPLNKLLCSLS